MKVAALVRHRQAANALKPVAIRINEETHMQVRANAGQNIAVSERIDLCVRSTVEGSLGRLEEQTTRVEVHLSDDNGAK